MKREFEHIIDEITEKQKRKAKETVLNDTASLFESFTTVEMYPISRLIVLFHYLSDLTIDFPLLPNDVLFESREKSSKSGRIHTQLRVIERILNLPDDVPSVVEGDTLIILNAYGYRSHHLKGRLYGRKNTMTLISRQCRYYLFGDILGDMYYDVDLRNAHPSILLSYADNNNIEVPTLKKYVSNREEFLADISDKSGMSRADAKIQVLRAINLITDKYLHDSLKSLFNDILPIRNHLFQTNLGDTITELGEYCLTRESFKKRNLEQQKISLQSHFCTTEESKSLSVLREVCLHKGKLDREATLNKKARNISFIPFFDGAYVNFDGLSFKSQVEEILKDTNDLIAPYAFDLKKIQPEWDYINAHDLKCYERIIEFIGGLSSNEFERLLEFLEIPEFSLDNSKLKIILNTVSDKRKTTRFGLEEDEDFRLLINEATKRYQYELRRKLLVYCLNDEEWKKVISAIKPTLEH